MAQQTSTISSSAAYQWGAFSLFFAAAVILGALGFEYIGGYLPCPLCLQQRYAYYLAIPALFLALILLSSDNDDPAKIIFFLASLVFFANAAFGVYHAGAEWGYWDAPSTCGSGTPKDLGSGGSLLGAIKAVNEPDCGKPAIVILGLSLAGWNAVACVILTIASLKAAFATAERA